MRNKSALLGNIGKDGHSFFDFIALQAPSNHKNEIRLHKILMKIILLWSAITILSDLDGFTSSKVDKK
jgi:hypothetical protein